MRYRTTFYRENYGFTPPLKQTVDIVFETDIPKTDDHVEEFENAAFNALLEQCPCFRIADPPLPGTSGWSSISGSNRYTEVNYLPPKENEVTLVLKKQEDFTKPRNRKERRHGRERE